MSIIEAAFTISKSVFDGEFSQTEGARQLNQIHNVNTNSAKIMIAVYGKLVKGHEFKRALSFPDMSYYLSRFAEEDNKTFLDNAVSALWKHITYYEEKNDVNLLSLRELHSKYLGVSSGIVDLDQLNDAFNDKVKKAQQMQKGKRQQKILESSSLPKVKTVTVSVYERSPYVVAEVLERADGICEKCNSPAPFQRKKDGSPYLEVHHKRMLSDGGKDTVLNAIALCPNCHREQHFGVIKT